MSKEKQKSEKSYEKAQTQKLKSEKPKSAEVQSTASLIGASDILSLNTKLILVALVGIGLLLFFTFKMDGFSSLEKDKVILTVNNQEITELQIQKEISKLPAYYLSAGIDEQTLRSAVIDQLIAKELIMEQANKLGVSVTDEEIQQTITELMAQSGLSKEDFEARLKEESIDEDMLYNLIKEQIEINKVIEKQVLVNIEVTEQEIYSYFEKYREDLIQVDVSHILICFNGALRCEQTRSSEEAYSIAEEIIRKIKEGGDFETLAKEYSDDPSVEFNSGHLGWIKKGQMVEEFESTAFALHPSEMTTVPVETDFGYHIILVSDTKTTYDDVKNDLVTTLTLEKQKTALEEYITSLKTNAQILWEESSS